MANAINIPKTHLIMGLSLPLAVLVGYFVAEPMELGSVAVVVFVLVVLSIPLMMKWYYPFLVLAWNSAIYPAFLPGRPALWAMLAFIGLLFAVLSRAVSANARFVFEPSVTKPLLALTAVVVATALMTGGFGVQMLGAGRYGGKNYFYFMAAVAGYFVFTSRRIPPHRAKLYVAMFLLSTLTFAASDLAAFGGSKLNFLWLIIPADSTLGGDASGGLLDGGDHIMRMGDLALVGGGLIAYLLARFGIRGLLDLERPWRLLLLLLALAAGLLSGFRSFVIQSGLTFGLVFYLEGLHRTRYAAALLAVMLLGAVVVLPQADKLPLVAQRALCFLPGKFDSVARESGAVSWEWRVEMWRQVLPEVPSTLFRARGWGFDAREFHTTVDMAPGADPLASTILVGNFHNGPLSILIPFGLYGAVAFIWFLVAGLRMLHRNWKFGSPALQRVNTLLLAGFAAHAVFFFGFFGSLQGDIAGFTGTLGLSVALNGVGAAVTRAAQPAAGVELNTEYVKA